MLTNPTYTGQLFAGRVRRRPAKGRLSPLLPVGSFGSESRVPPANWIVVGRIPAIISQEQFEMVQAKFARNRVNARRNNSVYEYLLRAMVSCGLCKLTCPAKTMNGKYSYYALATDFGTP